MNQLFIIGAAVLAVLVGGYIAKQKLTIRQLNRAKAQLETTTVKQAEQIKQNKAEIRQKTEELKNAQTRDKNQNVARSLSDNDVDNRLQQHGWTRRD